MGHILIVISQIGKILKEMGIIVNAQSWCAKLNKIKVVEKKNRKKPSRYLETLQADGASIP